MPTIRINWADNTAQLRENLARGLDQIEATKASAEKMVKALSGDNLIRAAHNYAAAVQQIGGANKLTAEWQDRVNRTVTKAIEQYKALGREAPTALRELAAATKAVESPTQKMTGQLAQANQLLSTFGVGISVGAIVAFGNRVLEAGDRAVKMAQQTSMSTEEVQRLDYIAGQTSVSVESLVSASQNLQDRLGSRESGLIGALGRLNINVEAFTRLSAYDQMTSLADAVRGIKNPTDQAAIAADVFGKNWKEILPAVKEGMRQVGDQAVVMSDQTVQSLDRIGDTLKKSEQIATSWGGQVVLAIEAAGFALGDLLSKFDPAHFGVTNSELLKMQGALNDPDGLAAALQAAKEQARGLTTQGIEPLKQVAAPTGTALADLNRQLDLQREAMNRDTEAAKKAAAALKAFRQQWADITQTAKGFLPIIDTIDGRVVEGIRFYVARGVALHDIADAYGLTAVQSRAMGEMLAVEAETAEMASRIHTGLANELKGVGTTSVNLASFSLPQLQIGLVGAAVAAGNLARQSQSLGNRLKADLELLPDLIVRSLTGGGGLTGALKAFGSTIGHTLSKSLAGTVASGIGGMLGSALGSVIGPLGSLLGPLIGKLFSIGGPSKQELAGRDLVAKFEQSFGGFDQMMQAVGTAYAATGRTLQQAQADVKALLDAEKQGPEVTQRWIDTINRAFTEQQAVEDGFADLAQAVQDAGGQMPSYLQPMIQKLIDLGVLTDDQKRKLLDIANGAPDFAALEKRAGDLGISLDALGPKFQQEHVFAAGSALADTFNDLKDAGADVGGVIAGMSDEVNDLVQDAKKYGASLPEALRPVVENLFNTGNLVDENGKKIEDLSGISFKDTPLDKSTTAIVTAIDKLRELFEKMPGVAGTAASGINSALSGIKDRKVTVEVQPKMGDMPRNDDGSLDFDGDPATPFARGGLVTSAGVQYLTGGGMAWPTMPTFAPIGTDTIPAMLTPGEIVLNAAQQERVASAITVGGTSQNFARDVATELARILPAAMAGGPHSVIENTIMLDGRPIAESVVTLAQRNTGGIGDKFRWVTRQSLPSAP